ncbi:hypothetical protein PG989_000917 [Apiospora arundinis]
MIVWRQLARVRDESKEHSVNQPPSIPEADGWDILWDSVARELRFKNGINNEEYLVQPPDRPSYYLDPTPLDGTQASTETDEPSPLLWREALRNALRMDYSRQVISKIILQGAVEINYAILLYEEPAETKYLEMRQEEIPLTPLEWAVEHGRADLLHLFLEAGADANKTCRPYEGPALMKAVRRENLHMVKVLAPLTHRVTCIRALCLAVDKQNNSVVDALLETRSSDGDEQHKQHVCCDFEDADRPLEDHGYIGWLGPDDEQVTGGWRVPSSHDFTAPLVRAVRHGNPRLVRALLDHGANPNLGYHGAGITIPKGWYDQGEKPEGHPPYPEFNCSRPVQLAMELHGHGDIVEMLLDAGADIALPQPVWPVPADMERTVPVHTCKLTPRSVYLKVTAALEAAVAQRKAGR